MLSKEPISSTSFLLFLLFLILLFFLFLLQSLSARALFPGFMQWTEHPQVLFTHFTLSLLTVGGARHELQNIWRKKLYQDWDLYTTAIKNCPSCIRICLHLGLKRKTGKHEWKMLRVHWNLSRLVPILVRVSRDITNSIGRRKRDRTRNQFTLLQKLTNLEICRVGWQAADPGGSTADWGPRKSWCFSSSSNAGKSQYSSSKRLAGRSLLTWQQVSLFILSRFSNWLVKSTHIRERNLLYLVYCFKC